MSTPANHEKLGAYGPELTHAAGGVIPTVKWRHMTRLLEITVGLLATVWGIQMFALWVEFLQWGTMLEFVP